MAFNDTFRFGAHAIILNSNGQVLQLKRTYGDKGWSFPGGSVEPGETIHQALYRECREELGTEVRDVHSEFRWLHLSELSEIHLIRVLDALEFKGQVTSRAF
ncbi:NUDIX hydrolase [Paenibacillus glycanilyticus]|uniref:NUDIX hydrolase n=1 Tax=Paenibacillus glycanilyticus TaxID=126569 RepID=A0ABQ6GD27_9BACL|nr:NUDIX hydrolase [Paenibacillus glycanilyticus]